MPLHVLCVDDDADIRAIVALALELDPAITVTFAPDGDTALILLAEPKFRPDCILLDLRLPDTTGQLLMGEIRCLSGMDRTPVVFMTALGGRYVRELATTLGATGFIQKPFNPLILATEVRLLIQRARDC